MNQQISKWPLWITLAVKEIIQQRAFSLFFVVNLALGMVGFLTVNSFDQAIDSHLSNRSKQIAGGDLIIKTHRPLNDAELSIINNILPSNTVSNKEVSLFTMAVANATSRLVQVRAIDEKFPLYGVLKLSHHDKIVQSTKKNVLHENSAWVSPELMNLLNLQVGESLKIGQQNFNINDVIDHDPSSSAIGFSIAPKVIIGLQQLDATELIKVGSRIHYSYQYQLNENKKSLELLKKKIESQFNQESKIKITTHHQSSQGLNRLLSYLNDYLALVSLIALFLSGVGATYLFRSLLDKQLKEIAILLSLGMNHGKVVLMHLTKFVLLGLIASVIASLLSLLLLPLIPAVSGSLVSQEVTLSVSLSSIVLSSLVVIVGGILFCLPQLLQIYQLRPAVLFHGEDDLPGHKKQWLNYFPVIIFYFVLACWQAQSIFVGSLFVIALSFTIAILILIAMILLSFLNSIRLKCGFETQMALLNLSRLRISTLTCFLALGLGGVLINLVPQIYKMMENQLNNPQESQLPSLFLFDIQQEQLPLLKTFMQTQPTKLNYVSSMIQTRLVAINGEKISTKTQLKNHQTREQQQFGRMQNRIYNITTRASLVPSEQIIEGDALSAIYDWDSKKLPLISIESSFAKQLGVTVGSTLSFDVFGVEIKSRVLNIRRVRWSSFHPNFYVKFQQGVLDDAPKTYIAAIPKLLFNEKMKVQNAIVKQFSNISIIDVDQIVDRILNISKQMNNAIILMAWVALIAGFCVLFFISRFQAQQRQYDFTLLKVLGCQFSQIRQIALIEFVILGGMAVLTGGLLSVIVSILLSYFIFDNHLVFYWQPLLLNTMLLILVSVLTGISATHHYLKIKPVSILR